jgi:hypothetical protein
MARLTVTIVLLVFCLFAGADGAFAEHVRVTQGDIAATRTYLRAIHALYRVGARESSASENDVRELIAHVRTQCPNVLAAAPQTEAIGRLRLQSLDQIDQATIRPIRHAEIAFEKIVTRLHWSNRKLTYYARGAAEEERANAELQIPDMCVEATAIAASGFHTVPAIMRNFDQREQAANSKVDIEVKPHEKVTGDLQEMIMQMLKPYERPDEKALIPRKPTGRQGEAVLKSFFTSAKELLVALGLPAEPQEEAPKPPGLASEIPTGSLGSEAHASSENYKVELVPPVQAGWVGWCIRMTAATQSEGGCPVTPIQGHPIFDEEWSGSAPPPVLQALVITSDQVAAVSLGGGPSVATRTEPTLPDGFRVALVEFSGKLSARAGMRFTPLDANGQPIPQSEPRFNAAGYQLITQSWRRPEHAPRGVCQITSDGLPGLTAQSGNVVPHLQAFKDLVGRPFMSCASTDYSLHNRSLEAGVILDATHPGSIPAPLPNMKPVPGHTGVFQAQGPNSEMVAQRIHRAWLLLEGGTGLQQRVTVLKHLHAKIRL